MLMRFEWQPRDLWVGIYWERTHEQIQTIDCYDVWICLLPMVPLHLGWSRLNPAWLREQERISQYVDKLLGENNEPGDTGDPTV